MLGIWIAVGSAIVGALTSLLTLSEQHKDKRHLIVLFIFVSAACGSFGAYLQYRDGEDAKRQLSQVQTTVALINTTVGDLAVLNQLGGDKKYYVQIAADTVPERLAKYRKDMAEQFGGDNLEKFVCIRLARLGSNNYLLLFGQGVSFASAQVFHQLAIQHRLSNGPPEIHEEPEHPPPCTTI